MRSGNLKWFDADKGYGFITPADGGEDIFVRKSALDSAGLTSIAPGTTLTFNMSRTDEGLQAVDIASA